MKFAFLTLVLGIWAAAAAPGQEPALPAGLGGPPPLPPGLAAERIAPAPETGEKDNGLPLPIDFSGFADSRLGARTQDDPYEKELSLGEIRLQLEGEKAWDAASLRVRTDFLYDPVYDRGTVALETGQGWFDLREARAAFTPLPFLDARIGRQIITWGTGDLVFINDLFPKDWNSFLIGRDTEYLKAPADAAAVSLFSDWADLDLVYSPVFDPDRYIDGSRISYFNPVLNRIAGRNAVIETEMPQSWFKDDEIAARIYRNLGSYELAAYLYHGFWKSPAGADPASGKATFPRLAVYGLSGRGAAGPGIANLEFGWYDSRDDVAGSDPLVRNGELRLLAGYEQEIAPDFSAGLQYYLEYMLNYGNYRAVLIEGEHPRDEARHLLTLRLTRRLLNQNLVLSLFAYWSPSDADCYLRPHVLYRIDDHWSAELGANLFWGEHDWTFFGQFAQNTNIYLAARYGF